MSVKLSVNVIVKCLLTLEICYLFLDYWWTDFLIVLAKELRDSLCSVYFKLRTTTMNLNSNCINKIAKKWTIHSFVFQTVYFVEWM